MIISLPAKELQLGVGLETGAEYLGFGLVVRDAVLRKIALESTSSILDIGCGSGRIARHFVEYTRPPGRYVGMDIQKSFVDWCTEHLSPANERLEFYHQDIFNGAYNPGGTYKASEYRFPFEDDSFDAIILYSVFTHLLPEDALNYLREIARLLKPGGQCFSSWFLMTPDVEVEYLLPNAREGQVGYGFPHCVEALEEAGLRVDGSQLGRWNGGESDFWQDLLWLRKADEVSRRDSREEPAPRGSDDRFAFSGILECIDPISNSITVAEEGGSRMEFGFSQQTRVKAHGEPGGLSDLRVGQKASVSYIDGASPDRSFAARLVVRGQPRVEQLKGIIEAVDWETNVVTLSIIGKGSVSVRLRPKQQARINGRDASTRELKPGQLATVHVILTVQTIVGRDPVADRGGSQNTPHGG